MRYLFHRSQSFRYLTRACVGVLLLTFAGAALAQHGGRSCKNHRHDHYDRYDHHDSRYDRRYDGRRYDDRYDDRRYDRRYRGNYRYADRGFEVPPRIKRRHLKRYRDYYYGSVYHDSHDHYHTVYSFPVYDHGRWTYRPHAYCEGSFFEVGLFTRIGGLRFGLNLRL